MTNTIELQPHTVHVTGLREYKTCRRRYAYGHAERLTPIEQLRSTGALWLGQGLHHALALHYLEVYKRQTEGGYVAGFPDYFYLLEGWEDYVDQNDLIPDLDTIDLAWAMLSGYQKFAADNDQNWKVKGVEVNLKILVPGTNTILEGTMDLLVEIGGHLWIVDHKGLKTIPNQNYLNHDEQMTGYLWLANAHGLRPRGVIYNALRKKIPTQPDILQNGQVSKKISIDTTHYVYEQALTDQGIVDWTPYEGILSKLRAKTDESFFCRRYLTRSKQELQSFEESLVAQIRELENPDTVMYPNPGLHCSMCDYAFMCQVQNSKGDVQQVKDTMFALKQFHER